MVFRKAVISLIGIGLVFYLMASPWNLFCNVEADFMRDVWADTLGSFSFHYFDSFQARKGCNNAIK